MVISVCLIISLLTKSTIFYCLFCCHLLLRLLSKYRLPTLGLPGVVHSPHTRPAQSSAMHSPHTRPAWSSAMCSTSHMGASTTLSHPCSALVHTILSFPFDCDKSTSRCRPSTQKQIRFALNSAGGQVLCIRRDATTLCGSHKA